MDVNVKDRQSNLKKKQGMPMSYNFLVDLYRNLTNLLHTHFFIICSSIFILSFRTLKFEFDVLCMLKKLKFLSVFFWWILWLLFYLFELFYICAKLKQPPSKFDCSLKSKLHVIESLGCLNYKEKSNKSANWWQGRDGRVVVGFFLSLICHFNLFFLF